MSQVVRLTRGQLVRRRFMRNRLAVFGLVTLSAMFLLAFLGPIFSKHKWDELDFLNLLQPPSREHWFGTTQIGGDVFALTMRGLQKSLIIGLLVALFSTGIAAMVGAFAGYLGGKIDKAMMWVVDLLLVLPSFLLIAIMSPLYRGKTWLVFVVLLAAFGWMITSRIVRGMAMSLRERDFIRAARYMGVPTRTIVFRHLIPNVASILIIAATLDVGGTILSETGLSYLGFGIQPPDVSLGSLIADGTNSALTYPWLFCFAGGALVLTVLSVSFIGDGLRDAFDPGAATGSNS
ncbi:MAG: ABC transporter permease [Actinobacteria bacterium]|nr:ABC transporter permease [Actinomycetota bacterium]